jgi:small conductance mechanosensitive channel
MDSINIWLTELYNWRGPLAAAVRIALILLGTWLAQRLATGLIRRFRIRIAARMTGAEEKRRAETLGRGVFRYLATIIICLIGGVLALSELGVSVAPILGAAGVVGLAIGFGAQSLVKDYFTGIFLLVENQIIKGDNGLISTVTNMSRGFAQAVVDVGVAYREDIDEALAIMRAVADELTADAAFGGRILDAFEVAGVERWDDSAVVLRGRFKVRPLEQWNVRREYLRRLKKAFDAAGIEIPFPHVTLYAGVGKDGRAPAFSIAGTQA